MNVKDFQQSVKRTADSGLNYRDQLLNWSLGMVCEAGEVGDLVKKHQFHGHKLNKDKVIEELGDVAFYLAALANTLEIDLEDVLQANTDKLRRRFPNGFSSEDSIARVDTRK